MNEHRSTGQRKRVDLLEVNGGERVLEDRVVELRRSRRDEPVAQPGEIMRDSIILDNRVLLPDFRGSFATELHVLFRGVPVLRRLDGCLRADRCRRHAERRNECRCARTDDTHHVLQRSVLEGPGKVRSEMLNRTRAATCVPSKFGPERSIWPIDSTCGADPYTSLSRRILHFFGVAADDPIAVSHAT